LRKSATCSPRTPRTRANTRPSSSRTVSPHAVTPHPAVPAALRDTRRAARHPPRCAIPAALGGRGVCLAPACAWPRHPPPTPPPQPQPQPLPTAPPAAAAAAAEVTGAPVTAVCSQPGHSRHAVAAFGASIAGRKFIRGLCDPSGAGAPAPRRSLTPWLRKPVVSAAPVAERGGRICPGLLPSAVSAAPVTSRHELSVQLSSRKARTPGQKPIANSQNQNPRAPNPKARAPAQAPSQNPQSHPPATTARELPRGSR
jgi:hypothetical protein